MSDTSIPLVNIGKRTYISSAAGYTQIPEEGASSGDNSGAVTNKTQELFTNKMPSTAIATTASYRNGKRRDNGRNGGRAGDAKGKGKGRYVDEDEEAQTLLGGGDERSEDERPRRIARSRSSGSHSVSEILL